jgi:Putative peptidoglycan binding domain
MMRRSLKVVLAVMSMAVLVAIGWWAASVALEAPEDPLSEPEPVTYTVDVGSVGRSLRFAAVAEWQFEDLARNASSGVVTSIGVDPGAVVSAGDILYTVDLRPVVVAEGVVPAFRDLSLRSAGDDVAQLQGLLGSLGFFEGEADGSFESGVRTAVRAWQKSLGIPDDGVVRLGDVVFVPQLPARVVLTDEVVVGAPLAGGEVAVRVLLDDVRFWIPLAPEQRSLVPLSADVLVSHGEAVWEARITEAVEEEGTGQLNLILEGSNGGPVCGDDCETEVSIRGQTSFPAEIVVVPETEGPLVPVAAIESLPDGSTVVTAVDGSHIPVVVVASSDGLAVVEGVDSGDVILLPMEVEGG